MLRSVVTVGATLGALVVLATCGARGSYAAPARLLYSHACFSFAIPDNNRECRATFAELQSKRSPFACCLSHLVTISSMTPESSGFHEVLLRCAGPAPLSGALRVRGLRWRWRPAESTLGPVLGPRRRRRWGPGSVAQGCSSDTRRQLSREPGPAVDAAGHPLVLGMGSGPRSLQRRRLAA